jgi:ribosome-associated protein
MDIHSLQAIVIDALEDIKAQDIKLFDTVPLTSLFDRVAIVSGTSNRQTRALAAHVRDKVKQAGGDVISVEGEETGEWVLVDLGDMVVHVMQPAIRSYYNLEELWGEYPIDYKATKKNMSRRTASPAETVASSDTPKTPIARKASAKKPAYEKGESTKSKASKAGTDSAKPAPVTARIAKAEPLGEAIGDAEFNAIGTAKVPPKTLPWRAAADKPGKAGSKLPVAKLTGSKSPLKATAKKTPATKTAAKKPSAKLGKGTAAPAKKAPAKK